MREARLRRTQTPPVSRLQVGRAEIGLRVEVFLSLDSHGTESIAGNGVAGKSASCPWIDDRSSQRAEVAAAPGGQGSVGHDQLPGRLSRQLVAREEEGLVLPDGSTDAPGTIVCHPERYAG